MRLHCLSDPGLWCTLGAKRGSDPQLYVVGHDGCRSSGPSGGGFGADMICDPIRNASCVIGRRLAQQHGESGASDPGDQTVSNPFTELQAGSFGVYV